jgi:hypothetical protein
MAPLRGGLLLAALAWLAVVGAEKINTVSTPEQLKYALDNGATHIEVTEHLDLTALDASAGSPPGSPDLFRPSPATHSIRVRR